MVHADGSWPAGLGGGSSISQVADICAPQETEVERLRKELTAARRVETAIIVGGATVSVTAMILSANGYDKAATMLTVAGTITGAIFAVLRLSEGA